jgi:BirA family transcriptional regulator, biotin operon repressor / biotin---[acetyl-CoA-carboxylase] ligase
MDGIGANVVAVDRLPLDAVALHAALDERWSRVTVVDETESTNADLLADSEAPDRSLLVAESQTAGRGRLDRSWVTPPRAGLTFSVLLRPNAPTATWSWLPLLAGVALCDAVSAATAVPVGLKWPNDLLQRPEEGKLAGILAQSSGSSVVIGIGLNVSTQRDELPVDMASSLAIAGSTVPDRTALLISIVGEVDHWLGHWVEEAGDPVASGLANAYAQRCLTLGRTVSVSTTAGEVLHGEAVGIDGDGRLEVLVDGTLRVIGAGDVEHVR